MTQSRDSGAAGNRFGRDNAAKLAGALGAELTRPGSNEALYNGELVALKSASATTSLIGVTYLMLGRVDAVVAALQRNETEFEVFALSAAAFRSQMKPTRSKGASAGRVGMVRCSVFEQRGRRIGMFALS